MREFTEIEKAWIRNLCGAPEAPGGLGEFGVLDERTWTFSMPDATIGFLPAGDRLRVAVIRSVGQPPFTFDVDVTDEGLLHAKSVIAARLTVMRAGENQN